ncbi:MAG: efflux RND transporter periplasmic adaptor subunit [Zetaproteobacteria bacterium]|nr:MAG: efflux RND transporter periplasmic adaptor subunit [Zetaproteobacteria bacterium]
MSRMSGLARSETFLLLALALAAAGCDGVSSATPNPGPPSRREAPGRPVQLVSAREDVTDRRVGATGTLAADEQVVLGTKVAGRVAELLVDLGSRVRLGDTVARLDPTDAQLRVDQALAALQQARVRLGLPAEGTDDRVVPEETSLVRQAHAVLEEARLTRDRTEQLWHEGGIARAQLDAAVASLAVAEGRYQDAVEEVRTRQAVLLQRRSELALARQQLADTVIVAPIGGAVSERRASVGEFLAAGAPVATLVKVHPLRLRLAVPERDAAAVRVGQAVRVTVEGVSREARGRVARVSPAISEQNRTLLVEAEVNNEDALLRPGTFATADIVVAGDVRVVTVPAAAVVTFAGVEKVLTVKDDKTVEVRVQTGRRLGDRVEIVAGISTGARVVAQPGNLTAGQPVTATDAP